METDTSSINCAIAQSMIKGELTSELILNQMRRVCNQCDLNTNYDEKCQLNLGASIKPTNIITTKGRENDKDGDEEEVCHCFRRKIVLIMTVSILDTYPYILFCYLRLTLSLKWIMTTLVQVTIQFG